MPFSKNPIQNLDNDLPKISHPKELAKLKNRLLIVSILFISGACSISVHQTRPKTPSSCAKRKTTVRNKEKKKPVKILKHIETNITYPYQYDNPPEPTTEQPKPIEHNGILAHEVSAKGEKIIEDGVDPDEKYINFRGAFKAEKLKESAYNAFKLARYFARLEGYSIEVFSGYRTPERQKRLYKKFGDEFTDKPGESWHQSGGAMDCYLTKNGHRITAINPNEQDIPKYQKNTELLERFMNQAGFIRHDDEIWHFEIGTENWAEILKETGYIDPEENVNIYRRDQLK